MKTRVNSHFVNTCDFVNVLEIAAFLKITAKQLSAAQAKGQTFTRSMVGTKLANWLVANKVDDVELEITAFEAEPDIGKAGANNKRKATNRNSKLTGAYKVNKNGARECENAEKQAMHDAIFSSATFEEFFAKAPAKAVVGKSIVTPSSMAAAFLKRGWIEKV